MTAKTIAEVLTEHHVSPLNEGGWFCFNCRASLTAFCDATAHQAAALSAAGFGLVADAGAKALEDAAEEFYGDLNVSNGPRIRVWLRARATAVRGEG